MNKKQERVVKIELFINAAYHPCLVLKDRNGITKSVILISQEQFDAIAQELQMIPRHSIYNVKTI